MITSIRMPLEAVAPVPRPPSYRPAIGRYIVLGIVALALAIGGFGSWAALAPLSSAALAPGIVKADSNRKTIQHLEGGIIADLLVRDGDRVRRGDVLVRLDDVDSRAEFAMLQNEADALRAREARLLAQREGESAIAFPAALLASASEPTIAQILSGQERIFTDQRAALASQIRVWEQRITRFRSQILTLETELVPLVRQLTLNREELADARMLFERGYGRKPHVLALERQVGDKEREIAAAKGNIEVLHDQITEAAQEIDSLRSARATAISEELREVQTQHARLEEGLRKASARLQRIEVTAPQEGVVMNARFFAPGAVVAPGGAILDLVPLDDKLVIEAMVRPLDIDSVRAGLPASVRLIAFKQRTTPTLTGRVTQLSADALQEERKGMTYYSAIVEVDADEMKKAPAATLYPGMPVHVSILTGERTFLDYLLQPISDTFALAFRED